MSERNPLAAKYATPKQLFTLNVNGRLALTRDVVGITKEEAWEAVAEMKRQEEDPKPHSPSS